MCSFLFVLLFFFKVFERFSYLSHFFISLQPFFFSHCSFCFMPPPCRSTTLAGSKNLSIFPKQKSLQNQTSSERFSPDFCLRFSFHFSFIFHVLTFLSLVLNIFVFDAFFKTVFLFLFKFHFFRIVSFKNHRVTRFMLECYGMLSGCIHACLSFTQADLSQLSTCADESMRRLWVGVLTLLLGSSIDLP